MRLDFRPIRLDTQPTLITGALAVAALFTAAGILAFLISLPHLLF